MPLMANSFANQISLLSISGLRIRDLTNIPQIVNPRDCPIMFPDTEFITNVNPTPENLQRTNGFWNMNRTFNYFVFYAEVGQGRGIFEHLGGMVSLYDSIVTKILNTDFTGLDVLGITFGGFGTLKDTNGKDYFGIKFGINVSELVNP